MKNRIYLRKYYMDKIEGFLDSDLIKVITGECVKIGLNQEKPYK